MSHYHLYGISVTEAQNLSCKTSLVAGSEERGLHSQATALSWLKLLLKAFPCLTLSLQQNYLYQQSMNSQLFWVTFCSKQNNIAKDDKFNI